MQKTIGFIGCGNMGKAMIGGMIRANLVRPKDILASVTRVESLHKLESEFGIQVTLDNKEVAAKADLLFLAVKPNMYPKIIEEIKNKIKEDVIIVSIAAGQSIEAIERCFCKSVKIVRTMPNTPALVGEGMSAITPNNLVTEEDLQIVIQLFNSFGKSEVVSEYLMDTVTAISGSSPAYVYMFIEAMADAGVMGGMPRQQAYTFAAQAVLGAAKMVLDTREHPGLLKDKVTSPGGTTIEAVAELEKQGMRNAVISAMTRCMEKSKLMSK